MRKPPFKSSFRLNLFREKVTETESKTIHWLVNRPKLVWLLTINFPNNF